MLQIPLTLLFLTGGPALAASYAATEPAIESEPTPAAAEVIAELYAFDRLQQDAIDSAETRGNEETRAFALAHADAAAKRDRALTQIRKQVTIDPAIDCRSGSTHADHLAALHISDGPDYVRSFYAVEVAEHRSAIALLQRYLAAPDNEAVRRFAAEQLPSFRSALEDAEAALTER